MCMFLSFVPSDLIRKQETTKRKGRMGACYTRARLQLVQTGEAKHRRVREKGETVRRLWEKQIQGVWKL